jgi:hypothetical protein
VDLNADGNLDILSGTYSRMDQDMAGTFQVLWGSADKTFSAAETLNGTDGEPLLLPGSREENLTDRICTRAFAADLNGDGVLDIVSGNFTGSFFVFLGTGAGQFAPESSMIKAGDEPLMVQGHSDPFLVDWDNDGDLDIVSGSSAGGVFLAINEGTKTDPAFAKATELLAPTGRNSDPNRFGDSHLTGPQSATRVWVDDVNQDGKLDLLVGDSVSLMFTAEGVDEEEARAKLEEWNKKQQELMTWWSEASQAIDLEAMSKLMIRKRELEASGNEEVESSEGEIETESASEGDRQSEGSLTDEELASLEAYENLMKEYRERSQEVFEGREEFVRSEMTGFVWLLYQE